MLRRTRTWIPLAAVLVVAVVVALLSSGGGGGGTGGSPHPAPQVQRVSTHTDPHPALHLPARQRTRLLRAAARVADDTPSAELVSEGRDLFRSVPAGRQGESCEACHTEGAGNGDEGNGVEHLGEVIHSTDPKSGFPGDFDGPRDAPSLWNVAQTAPYGWKGDQPTVEDFVISAIKTHFADANPTPERVAALSAYVRTFLPPVSAYDLGTMSPAAVRGEKLFDGKAGCNTCHVEPLFTDRKLHEIGVPEAPGANDPGPFDTPQLRDVKDTAPYMHNGIFKTLQQVVDFYDKDATTAPLHLTAQEKADLVAFLESL
jgi:cytochrome c peroxidase